MTKTAPRRKARELTLKALYAAEHGSGAIDRIFDDLASKADLSEKNFEFARRLYQLTMAGLAWTDERISSLAENWRLDRINAIDRSILRMAMVELKEFPDSPVKVVINEAIELAKAFSTPESPSFVNGILDSFVKKLQSS